MSIGEQFAAVNPLAGQVTIPVPHKFTVHLAMTGLWLASILAYAISVGVAFQHAAPSVAFSTDSVQQPVSPSSTPLFSFVLAVKLNKDLIDVGNTTQVFFGRDDPRLFQTRDVSYSGCLAQFPTDSYQMIQVDLMGAFPTRSNDTFNTRIANAYGLAPAMYGSTVDCLTRLFVIDSGIGFDIDLPTHLSSYTDEAGAKSYDLQFGAMAARGTDGEPARMPSGALVIAPIIRIVAPKSVDAAVATKDLLATLGDIGGVVGIFLTVWKVIEIVYYTIAEKVCAASGGNRPEDAAAPVADAEKSIGGKVRAGFVSGDPFAAQRKLPPGPRLGAHFVLFFLFLVSVVAYAAVVSVQYIRAAPQTTHVVKTVKAPEQSSLADAPTVFSFTVDFGEYKPPGSILSGNRLGRPAYVLPSILPNQDSSQGSARNVTASAACRQRFPDHTLIGIEMVSVAPIRGTGAGSPPYMLFAVNDLIKLSSNSFDAYRDIGIWSGDCSEEYGTVTVGFVRPQLATLSLFERTTVDKQVTRTMFVGPQTINLPTYGQTPYDAFTFNSQLALFLPTSIEAVTETKDVSVLIGNIGGVVPLFLAFWKVVDTLLAKAFGVDSLAKHAPAPESSIRRIFEEADPFAAIKMTPTLHKWKSNLVFTLLWVASIIAYAVFLGIEFTNSAPKSSTDTMEEAGSPLASFVVLAPSTAIVNDSFAVGTAAYVPTVSQACRDRRAALPYTATAFQVDVLSARAIPGANPNVLMTSPAGYSSTVAPLIVTDTACSTAADVVVNYYITADSSRVFGMRMDLSLSQTVEVDGSVTTDAFWSQAAVVDTLPIPSGSGFMRFGIPTYVTRTTLTKSPLAVLGSVGGVVGVFLAVWKIIEKVFAAATDADKDAPPAEAASPKAPDSKQPAGTELSSAAAAAPAPALAADTTKPADPPAPVVVPVVSADPAPVAVAVDVPPAPVPAPAPAPAPVADVHVAVIPPAAASAAEPAPVVVVPPTPGEAPAAAPAPVSVVPPTVVAPDPSSASDAPAAAPATEVHVSMPAVEAAPVTAVPPTAAEAPTSDPAPPVSS